MGRQEERKLTFDRVVVGQKVEIRDLDTGVTDGGSHIISGVESRTKTVWLALDCLSREEDAYGIYTWVGQKWVRKISGDKYGEEGKEWWKFPDVADLVPVKRQGLPVGCLVILTTVGVAFGVWSCWATGVSGPLHIAGVFVPIVGACAIGASLVKAKLLRRWQRWVYLPLLVLMCIACLKAQSDIRDSLDRAYGVGRMGPTRVLVVTITNKYVEEEDDDRGNHYDSYRVATSSGDFEDVDKDIFDQLDVGTRYRIATQGNRVHNWWCSSTPEIIDSEPLSPPGRSEDEGR